jgi:pyruvate dehydrogenase E1 component beta subunit
MAETLFFNALREAIDEEMAKDPTVLVMGEDVGHYGGSYKVTKDLCDKYGDWRLLDTPIAENSFMGMAIGAAMTGLRPIVEGMNMGFLLLAFNQISNNAGRRRQSFGRGTLPAFGELFSGSARIKDCRLLDAAQCQGLAQGRDPGR